MEGFIDISEVLRVGIYILSYRGEIVFIGKSSGAMLVKIAGHRSAKNKDLPPWFPIRGIRFDKVYIRAAHPDRIDCELAGLIVKHNPRYNLEPWMTTTIQPTYGNFRRI